MKAPCGQDQAIIVGYRRHRLSFAPALQLIDPPASSGGASLSNCGPDGQAQTLPGETSRASTSRRRLSVASIVSVGGVGSSSGRGDQEQPFLEIPMLAPEPLQTRSGLNSAVRGACTRNRRSSMPSEASLQGCRSGEQRRQYQHSQVLLRAGSG